MLLKDEPRRTERSMNTSKYPRALVSPVPIGRCRTDSLPEVVSLLVRKCSQSFPPDSVETSAELSKCLSSGAYNVMHARDCGAHSCLVAHLNPPAMAQACRSKVSHETSVNVLSSTQIRVGRGIWSSRITPIIPVTVSI